MKLTILFLLITFSSFSQSDSINKQWNNCIIDTVRSTAGIILEINISQQEWSKSKKQIITRFWKRSYYDGSVVKIDYSGIKYYTGKADIRYEGVKKFFNESGRRIDTEQVSREVAIY